jgi:protein SCO1/2
MKSALQVIACFLLIVITAAVFPVGSAQAESKKYKRSVEKYTIPDVVLVNQDGKKVRLASLVDSEQPVIVDFIYGTCTTICPVLSAGFVNLQAKLGPSSQNVRLVSITIDPENDTPKVMKEYLKRFRAKPGWDFLTGSRADIDAVMRAFNAYIPDKMSHYPLNLIRMPKDGRWVRLYGLMSSRELLEEYQQSISGS